MMCFFLCVVDCCYRFGSHLNADWMDVNTIEVDVKTL